MRSTAGEGAGVAIVYVHGIGTHPRSTVKESFATALRRALGRETQRAQPSNRWKCEAVAGCVSPRGVIPAQRLTFVQDDDRPCDGVPQLDVYEVPWSATVRYGTFRWSSIAWMAKNVRNLGSVISFRPPAKGLSDTAAAAVLGAAVFSTVASVAFAVFVAFLVLIWFAAATVAQRIGFVSSFVPALMLLALIQLVMFFFDQKLGASPSPDVVDARTGAHHPRRRFWRLVYDRMPEFNAFGALLRRARIAVFWFIIIGNTVLSLEQSRYVPRSVVGPVVAALLAIGIVVALVRWFCVLEDLFGDVEVFAAEDPLDGKQVERRERIIDDIRSLIAAVGAARPGGRLYDRVVLVAHSLGSALLADCLADDADRAALGDEDAIARLRRVNRLVVYGSPIASFRRFFASRASDERRRREARFAQLAGIGVVATSSMLKLDILNIWCCADPVSNPFPAEFGSCENREVRGVWGMAHVRYTSSRKFWACVLPALLDQQTATVRA